MSQSRKQVKTTNLNMRIAPQLKAEFVAAAANEDVSAGQALRAFMRRYIAKHRNQGAVDASREDVTDRAT